MASYQARGRDPLFDSDTAATLERRGRELVGVGLVIVGLIVSAMIASYSPDDPSFLSATDAPVQNWMGRMGAYIAAPLFMIVGAGAWALAAVFLTWGGRLILHRGQGRAMTCLIFAPIWVALCSVYASGLTEGAEWGHNFGMGGLFGDMMMGSIIGILPFSAGLGLKLAQLFLGLGILGLGAFVLGFTRPELKAIGRFGLIGLLVSYATFVRIAGRSASGAMSGAMTGAQRLQAAQQERRARRMAEAEAEAAAQEAMPMAAPAPLVATRVRRADPLPAAPVYEEDEDDYIFEDDAVFDEPAVPAQPEKGGFLSRMPALIRRADPMPEPELVTREVAHDIDAPGEDRIRAKIAKAVSARGKPVAVPGVQKRPDPTKPLTKGRGHGPQPLIFKPQTRGVPPEPPLTAAARTLPPEPPLTAHHAAPMAAGVATDALTATRGLVRAPEPQGAMPRFAEPRHAEPRHVEPQQTMPRFAEPRAAEPRAPVAQAPVAQPMPEPEEAWQDDAAFAEMRDFDDYGDDDRDGDRYDDQQGDRAEAWQAEDSAAWSTESVGTWSDDDFGEADEATILDHSTPAPTPIHRAAPALPEPKKVVQQPVRKPVQLSTRAKLEAQPDLSFEDRQVDYELPPLSLLMSPDQVTRHILSDEALEENARMLESVLDDYGVKGEIVSVRPGPVVTMYELEPAPGLKASRVIGLADDIARSMSALSARVSTVPGRSVIGIELPNDNREMVCFREILAGREFGDGNHKLPLALGKNIGGDPVVANLAKMPHLLIAGTTGSGKSVAINTMILSLLYKLTPEDLRLVMIDPKMLELSVYDGIPHLLSPVVTDPKKAVVALKWVVGEMEDRYRKMSKMGVRNIDGYNDRVADALSRGEMFERTVQTGFDDETGEPVFETEQIEPKKMPYIVVIVDEMADLMMVAGKEIEACIQRLAQMARASGIHLVMATQRPSVDVITGTIKANFPTRISFQVTSKIDSRTILGEMGAEQLLGMGDMLYMAGGSRITRCHGPFVSDEEVEEIVNHLKAFGPPDYVSGVVQGPDDEKADNIDAVLGLNTGGNTGGEDALYDQAVAIVIKDRKCSTSYIQRKLGIGYNKAARLVEQMEEEGVVSAANHVGKREILVPEQQ
ncbi:DNA translocase FtsK [Ponticoccus litoralis]|uniref:DNA translocase FtsK n=2 Tax=Pseudomonadota TaxID=1224 RepID=A0AAW9SI00_9RHOB